MGFFIFELYINCLLLMLKKLPYFIILLLTGVSSCIFKDQDRTTQVFGTVTNDINQPVARVPILISGKLGFLSTKEKDLTTVFTDTNGKYSATLEVPKGYHSLEINNMWFYDDMLANKYRNHVSSGNQKQASSCCRAEIGEKTQFDFVLILK